MTRRLGAISRSSSPKPGLSQVVIRAFALPSCRFSPESLDFRPVLFQENPRDSRRWCAAVKNEAKRISGAEITNSGLAMCSKILPLRDFRNYWVGNSGRASANRSETPADRQRDVRKPQHGDSVATRRGE